MTNGEFYKEKLESIDKMDRRVAIKNDEPVPCTMHCEKCCMRYTSNTDCSDLAFVKWYNSEYIPPKPKLTKYEKAVLSLLEKGFIARDANGSIYFYENIPSRKRDEWCSNGKTVQKINVGIGEKAEFKFIKWKDEPITIEEMLTWEVEE